MSVLALKHKTAPAQIDSSISEFGGREVVFGANHSSCRPPIEPTCEPPKFQIFVVQICGSLCQTNCDSLRMEEEERAVARTEAMPSLNVLMLRKTQKDSFIYFCVHLRLLDVSVVDSLRIYSSQH